jgi:heme O synthase-like polyprenyltransferase
MESGTHTHTSQGRWKEFLDLLTLLGTALLVIAIVGGAFLLTEARHISPMWVFLSVASIGFVAGAREDYRKEFRSIRFVLFVCAWLVVNIVVIVVVLGSFGWLYLIPALLLEQFFFYMTAYWFFGLQPPLRHRRQV